MTHAVRTAVRSRSSRHDSLPGNRPIVLCVDDDPDVTQAIAAMLAPLQVEVRTACCGSEGIWAAIHDKPDVIVTDLLMGEGSGEELVECLRRNAQTRHIPVVVLTGKRGTHLAGQLRKCGADAFLRKPIQYTALLTELSRFISLTGVDPQPHATAS